MVPDEDKNQGNLRVNEILGNLLGCARRSKLLTIIISLLLVGGLIGIICCTVLLTTQNEQTEHVIGKGKNLCVLNVVS